MAHNDQNDKELNNYLNGNSDLSNSYRASNTVEPPVHLDEAILLSAKEAVVNAKQEAKPVFHRSRWTLPVSIAAVITLSVSLVVTMQQETGQPLISQPEVEMFDSAVMSVRKVIPEKKIVPESIKVDDGVSVVDEVEVKQNKNENVDVLSPAALGAVGGYRAEQNLEAPKVKMKERAARKKLKKQKARIEVIKESTISRDQVLQSTPMEAEFDALMDFKEDRQRSQQENTLLRIKRMWEEGNNERAKELFNQFLEGNPSFSEEAIEEVIGEELFYLIKESLNKSE
jgi:hypothetical protein